MSHKTKNKKSRNKTDDKKISYFEFPVVRKCQKGKYYFSGEMSLAALRAITTVDCYDSSDPEKLLSAQRSKIEKQAKEFAKFIIRENNVCFSEILINARYGEVEFISLREMGIEIPCNRKLETTTGFIRIPSNAILYVYDGGTRRKAYLSILEEDLELMGTEDYQEIKNFNIPFCLSQVPAMEETRFFLNHNGKQKKVSSDHRAIVSYHANKDCKVITNQSDVEYIHELVAGACFHMVGNRLNPWYKKIIMADTEKDATRLVTVAGFKTGLKAFVRWANREFWSPETTDGEKSKDLSDICTTFWKAVKISCPKMWRNLDDYILSSSQGVSSLSMLMGSLYQDMFNSGKDWTIDNISKEIKKSKILRTPKKWEKGGDLNKKGGGYKALEDLSCDIFKQIKGIK